ncbi:MAG: molybdopterin molybdotransferase MoeA [Parasporobacterium sp.]|nr:molybdopterin molybdotransferase MoeA [Parasporobacterium sp.]
MKYDMEYAPAREMIVSFVEAVETERVDLDMCGGRILAAELTASENVPAFDRSPYDGYAFRAEDTKGASRDHPVTLAITEEIPAGSVPTKAVTPGTAAKILTGAPVPEGADAVIMYEKTEFTETEVSIFSECTAGDNIIYAGEDVKAGTVLAEKGTLIDPGLAGTLAAQGEIRPLVYRKPVAGIISTGSEVTDNPGEVPAGMIRNTNRYSLAAALQKDGCETVYLGLVGDRVKDISRLISEGLKKCDLIVLTGGVSAGDYDLTPQAMEAAGCELLFKGVRIKPGMACCYGMAEGKPVCGLSGNPSSSLINYYTVLRPAVRKMTGLKSFMPAETEFTLTEGFGKKSRHTRVIKGRVRYESGQVMLDIPKGQGNVVISSSIGCDGLAVVPEGTDTSKPGAVLRGFII